MKTNHRMIFAVTIFAGLLARPALADKPPGTNALGGIVAEPPAAIVAPAPAPAPVVKTTKPSAKKKITSTKKVLKAKSAAVKKKAVTPTGFSVPLTPGAATVSAKRVNIRGQATIHSEIVGHLTNGEPVTVIEEVTSKSAKDDEPSIWAKIVLPSDKHLWVNAQFVDTLNKLVHVKKLNIRTGPGENYSIAGHLLKGDAITDIGSTNGWLEIQAPTNAFAYVAAAYLKQEAPVTTPVVTTPPVDTVPTTTTTVADSTPVAAPPTEPVAVPITTSPATATSNAVATVTAPAEPELPRIVQREGIVRRTFSIQAPTTFQLVNPDTGRPVNYLYTTAKTLDLARYKGLHIVVTGEESLDERWVNTPIITIQKIQVVE
jgi:uncharacterized protein YgiM (DUF1202 family)